METLPGEAVSASELLKKWISRASHTGGHAVRDMQAVAGRQSWKELQPNMECWSTALDSETAAPPLLAATSPDAAADAQHSLVRLLAKDCRR